MPDDSTDDPVLSHSLTDLELSVGFPLGVDMAMYEQMRQAQHNAVPGVPRELLLDTVGASLRERTIVQFSGGVDSSLVLAAAAVEARRRDLPPPTAFTLRYPHEESNETDYQEMMIEHAGITDWIILDVDDELDLLGADSVKSLVEYGVLSAAPLSAREWFLSQLPKGPDTILLSGEGGDEVLGPAPFASVHALRWAFTSRWNRRLVLSQWVAATRSQLGRRGRPVDWMLPPWLTPLGVRAVSAGLRHHDRPRSATMRSWMRNYRAKRGMLRVLETFGEQSARHNHEYAAPLLDIEFIARIGASIPEHDFVTRQLVIRKHMNDLVPTAISERETKAGFNSAYLGEHTRSFAEQWDGTSGVPLHYVDPDKLRDAWRHGSDARSGLMLQSAYLASRTKDA